MLSHKVVSNKYPLIIIPLCHLEINLIWLKKKRWRSQIIHREKLNHKYFHLSILNNHPLWFNKYLKFLIKFPMNQLWLLKQWIITILSHLFVSKWIKKIDNSLRNSLESVPLNATQNSTQLWWNTCMNCSFQTLSNFLIWMNNTN